MTFRWLPTISTITAAVAVALAGAAIAAPKRTPEPVHRAGRWLVDDQGRVVVNHGFNVVDKNAPYVRSEFGRSDVRLLTREGFTVVRFPFVWEAVEPQPGDYDAAYVNEVVRLIRFMGHNGIRVITGFHQDAWSRTAIPALGDGAPAWATLGGSNSVQAINDSFAAFWRNDAASDGVGIQTHFLNALHYVAHKLRAEPALLGWDPFNEPYAGSSYPACGLFERCPAFETGVLRKFYSRATEAIRSAGASQLVLAEGVADGTQPPALPKIGDAQTGFNFHYYCSNTQLSTQAVPVGSPSPEADACSAKERTQVPAFTSYARQLGVPAVLTEFSCTDVNPDNAQVVDLIANRWTTWTVWAYYPMSHGSDCPGQGLLKNGARTGSEANAKQDKLDALAVPYASAIAGTPEKTALNRATRRFTLRYRDQAVKGAELAADAETEIFVPRRMYPDGYIARVHGARIKSAATARWLRLASSSGHPTVTVHIAPSS